jgi:bacterioferritin-associated ferredoxin
MISDRDVRASVKPCGASADRARDVFKSKGCLPKCGKCVKNIQGLCDREASLKIEGSARRGSLSRLPQLAIAAE